MYSTIRFRKIVLFLALISLAATAAADTNTIQIYVHPGSGTVCLDSMCLTNRGTLGGYSSTQFAQVASGQQHTIRVYSTEGYQDYTDQVYMDNSGHSMTFRIYLEPIPAQTASPGTGTLLVTVSPGLGQVCIDNKECESGTGEPSTYWSVQFSDVPADTAHTITVTADGYQPYSQQVTLRPDQRNDVDITLQPLLEVTSAGAQQSPPVSASPQTPRAAMDGSLPLFAAGIGSAVFLCRKQGK